MMKKSRLLIILLAVALVAYLVGFLHGNRSAAVVCLEQAAADTHAGYRLLADPKCEQWRDGTDRMLLGAARRALLEEKKHLQNPFRLYLERQRSDEVRRGSVREERDRIDKLLSQWEAVLNTNRIPENTQPPLSPVL